MAKNRNKGFSLIEVIIGVAVLTILLTPVVKQLAQTMRTNRLAKEQQYANESAMNALEYAQTTSFNELKVPGTSGDVYVTASPDATERECEILIYDGVTGDIKSIDDYASEAGKKLKYTNTIFKLNDVELGSRNTEYSRTLILDDLANKVSSYQFTDKLDSTKTHSLKIHYSTTGTETVDESFGDYTFTNEGSIVKYTTDADDKTYISGIVCELKDEAVSDPNETLLGSMNDLVSTQVAMVNGDVSKYDKQAQDEYFAAALEYVRINNPERYDAIVNNKLIGGDTATPFIGDFAHGLQKSTTIHITKDKELSGKPYYFVKIDVVYRSPEVNIKLEYNAFSQKFFYEEKKDADGNVVWEATVPAVYIEYQPFSSDGEAYATSENLYIDNQVDGAKIYMYQPAKDMMYMSANTGANVTDVEASTGNYKITRSSTSYVHLNINTLVNDATKQKSTYVYTNLDLITREAVESDHDEENNSKYQFDTYKIDSSIYPAASYAAFDEVNPAEVDSSKTTLFLKTLDEDTTTSDRLYTATVIVAPKTESVNTVTLTGAKGGQ